MHSNHPLERFRECAGFARTLAVVTAGIACAIALVAVLLRHARV